MSNCSYVSLNDGEMALVPNVLVLLSLVALACGRVLVLVVRVDVLVLAAVALEPHEY